MSTLGFVMAGGAARGAYQAGMLRYLFKALPKNLGYVPWPAIVSGTSVGALNGVFVAARTTRGIDSLSGMWQDLSIEQVYQLPGQGMWGALRNVLRPAEGASMLDATPLMRLVSREFPGRELREAIGSGQTQAFIVSATGLATGFNVLFLDSANPDLNLQPLSGTRVKRVRTKAKHLLASAALPMLFPPVTVDDALYVDGGLRQNTPLRPTIRAGADRVLVLGVHVSKETEARTIVETPVPSLPFLAGKSLNALLLDPVERDLQQAQTLNSILNWGAEHYGPEFLQGVKKDLGLNPVELFFFRPQEDLGRIASATWKEHPPKVAGQLGWLLSSLADRVNDPNGESDLLSYLFFDRAFTGQLEALGFEDARRREEELVAFLGADPPASAPPPSGAAC